MSRQRTRREKRALAKLMKRRSRSLAMWGQASTPSLAEPEVTRLDRHAREVTCPDTDIVDIVDMVDSTSKSVFR